MGDQLFIVSNWVLTNDQEVISTLGDVYSVN